MKKTGIALISVISTLSFANDFVGVIHTGDTIAEKTGTAIKNISKWTDVDGTYDCSIWSPDATTIDFGFIFTQNRDCLQNQSRTKDFYKIYNTGEELFEKTIKETQTITITESQSAVGTKNFKDTERADSWSIWSDQGSHYNCKIWSPSPSVVDYGDSFTQTRDCSQSQERTRDIYDVWADGSETYNRTESGSQIITETESQSAIGTKNFKDAERADSWSSWSDEGSHYDCEIWTPNVDTVDYGDSFTQTRDCSQNQKRSRDVYDVWADGSETYNRTESGSQIITETESQSAIGTKNFKDTERANSWSSWSDKGTHYNCGVWTPNVNTVNLGSTFTQTRDCSQSQERTRDIYDVWADGSETYNRTESGSQIITETESRSETGTKNFISTTRTGNWSGWSDSGSQYNCSSWSPLTSTINLGSAFTQTQSCKQNQTRSRTIYNVWANGTETVKNTESGNQTITETNSRGATGTKNYKTGDLNYGSWSGWSDSGSHHSCGSWSPATSTVNLGQSFTQTRSCKQNQTRTRSVYEVWADSSQTYKNTETQNQTINENESKSATGTKNYITGTSSGSWTAWQNTGGHYDCSSWYQQESQVSVGVTFTQTRWCSQSQQRTKPIYNNWANGGQTVKETMSESQSISVQESRQAVGTRPWQWTNTNYQSGLTSCSGQSSTPYGTCYNKGAVIIQCYVDDYHPGNNTYYVKKTFVCQ